MASAHREGWDTALGTAEVCKGHLAQVRIWSPLLWFATKRYQTGPIFLFTLPVLLSHEVGHDVFRDSREVLGCG